MDPRLILIQSLVADFKRIQKAYDDDDLMSCSFSYLRDEFFAKIALLKKVCDICEKSSYKPLLAEIETISLSDEFRHFLPACISICEYLESRMEPKFLALPASVTA